MPRRYLCHYSRTKECFPRSSMLALRELMPDGAQAVDTDLCESLKTERYSTLCNRLLILVWQTTQEVRKTVAVLSAPPKRFR